MMNQALVLKFNSDHIRDIEIKRSILTFSAQKFRSMISLKRLIPNILNVDDHWISQI